MVLVNARGRAVKEGDIVSAHDGERYRVVGWQAPLHYNSSGRMFVQLVGGSGQESYFPHVFRCKFVDASKVKL